MAPRGGPRRPGRPDTRAASRALLAAAGLFAGTVAATTVVAIRDDLPGRPLGLEVPLSVPVGILVGWGAGVAAPWPMPVAALVAATRAGREEGAGPALVCAGVGIAGLVGLLIEPNTHTPQAWSPANRAAVLGGFVASGTLAAVALWHAGQRGWGAPRPEGL